MVNEHLRCDVSGVAKTHLLAQRLLQLGETQPTRYRPQRQCCWAYDERPRVGMPHPQSRLKAALRSKGDNHEVRVNSLPDVEHFGMLREQHTANGADPPGDDSFTAAETPELPA